MCHSMPRSSRQLPFSSGSRNEWAAWLPLLFIGAMLFWTVAVGLGTWSLMIVSDEAMDATPPAATAIEPAPGVEGQGTGGMVERITVQMEESQEAEDVNDNAGNVGGAGVDWTTPAQLAPAALSTD
jgi:hypothetical protein